jgi:hypothetical protein
VLNHHWHTYSAILTAIAPDDGADWEFNAVSHSCRMSLPIGEVDQSVKWTTYLYSSYRTYTQVLGRLGIKSHAKRSQKPQLAALRYWTMRTTTGFGKLRVCYAFCTFFSKLFK